MVPVRRVAGPGTVMAEELDWEVDAVEVDVLVKDIADNAGAVGVAEVTEGGIIELKKALSDHKPIWAEIAFPKDLKSNK